MSRSKQTRRGFLQTSAGTLAAGAAVPYFFTGEKVVAAEAKAESKTDRPLIGQIGCGGQGNGDTLTPERTRRPSLRPTDDARPPRRQPELL